jgi:hypothetical protein
MKMPKRLRCDCCIHYGNGRCDEVIKNMDIDWSHVIVEDDWFCGYFDDENNYE